MKRDVKAITTIPFGGGADVRHQNEAALIPAGGYSAIQNMRNMHPGLKKRPGCAKLHTTADGTNKVMSLYQFVKGKKTERHFFAQMSDSDVLEATAAPPGVTAGVFGSEVFSGSASPLPASYANLNDFMLFCNGVDLPQIYPGLLNPIDNFYQYSGPFDSTNLLNVSTGIDYSTEVTDGDDGTYADISSMTDLLPAVGAEIITNGTFAADTDWTKETGWTIGSGIASYAGEADTLGAELITNGVFSADTDWTKGGVWAISGGVASTTDNSPKITQAIPMTPDLTYYYSIDVTLAANGPLNIYVGSTFIVQFTTTGTYTGYFVCPGAGDIGIGGSGTVGVARSCDNFSVKLFTEGGSSKHIKQTVSALAIGTQYQYSIGVVHNGESGRPITLYAGTQQILTTSATATHTGFFVASSAATEIIIYSTAKLTGNSIDNGSLKTYSEISVAAAIVFIRTPVPVQSLGFVMLSANGTASVAMIKYFTGIAFSNVTGFTDGTSAASKAFAQSGSMTWTAPTDETPGYIYNQCGYWYMLYLSSGACDSDTKISSVTYESAWQPIRNIWDGVPVDVIEAQKYTNSTGGYTTYAAEAITLNSMAAADALYFSSYDDIENIFVDVLTPNATGDTLSLSRWNGTAWVAVTITDTTTGFVRSGRIVFARGNSQRQSFNNTGYMAHWYKLTTGSALAASVLVGLRVQPYFDITDIGKGQTVCAWKNQAVYGTDQDHYLYVSAPNKPQALNGDNSTMLEPGDGRFNRPVALRNFKDDLMAWQEEKGKEGGCLTKFTWVSSISDIRKTTISTSLGAMSSKSVDVVDGVEAAELNRDIPVMTLAFCLSRSGVYITDGSVCYMISKDIANYFDPNDATCIRVGYEKEMWLKYDSAYGVVRLGLVSGSAATLPNVFPVYDVKSKTWSNDSLAQELSCMTEAEAASGSVPVLQIGGGIDDGFVYLLNSGLNDVTTAIDSYATLEFDAQGNQMCMNDLVLRVKCQSAGSVTVTPNSNGIAASAKTLSQTAARTNHKHRRHRTKMNIVGDHIGLKFQHSTASEDCYLLDYGVAVEVYEEQ